MKDAQERWYGVVMTKEAREILNRLRGEKALLAAYPDPLKTLVDKAFYRIYRKVLTEPKGKAESY